MKLKNNRKSLLKHVLIFLLQMRSMEQTTKMKI